MSKLRLTSPVPLRGCHLATRSRATTNKSPVPVRDCHLGNKVEGYDQQVSVPLRGLPICQFASILKKPPRCPICSRIYIFHDLSESWQTGKTHSHSGQMLARILAKWQEPQNQWEKLGKQIRGHLLLQLTAWQWDRATAPTTAFFPYTRDSVFSRSCNQGLRSCVPVVSRTCLTYATVAPSGKAISAGGRRARPSGQEGDGEDSQGRYPP